MLVMNVECSATEKSLAGVLSAKINSKGFLPSVEMTNKNNSKGFFAALRMTDKRNNKRFKCFQSFSFLPTAGMKKEALAIFLCAQF